MAFFDNFEVRYTNSKPVFVNSSNIQVHVCNMLDIALILFQTYVYKCRTSWLDIMYAYRTLVHMHKHVYVHVYVWPL